MYIPKFQLILESEQFYPDEFICLGSQLSKIVDSLKKNLISHIWYGANLVSLDDFDRKKELNSFKLLFLGDDKVLKKMCSDVGQFLSGVLFAVDSKFSSQNIDNVLVDTEDEQYRPVDINGVLVEIRLFDTSYFEIYSEDEKIIKNLANEFKVPIINLSDTSS